MTREEAIHIVNVAFGVPQAIRRAGENRTYFEDEIREAKGMAIKALEQEPKTGKWLETDSADPYWYMCSECHRRLFEQEAFCPSCGAKMKREV